jgi:hypothetical protein
VNDLAPSSGTVTEHGFRDIFGGNIYLLAIFQIGDAAFRDGIRHGFLDLAFEAPDKTLAVDGAFVFGVESPIDYA